jgi:hypothetical protein
MTLRLCTPIYRISSMFNECDSQREEARCA